MNAAQCRNGQEFAKAHKHTPKLLKLFLGRDLSPSRDEYDRVVDALWDGDVEMDKLMVWMYDSDTAAARKMLNKRWSRALRAFQMPPNRCATF